MSHEITRELECVRPIANHRSEDRRQADRMVFTVPVRLLAEDQTEHRGMSVDLSHRGIRIQSGFIPNKDERIIAYLDSIGRFEGIVVRRTDDDFAIAMRLSDAKLDRLKASIDMFFARHAPNVPISDRRQGADGRREFSRPDLVTNRHVNGMTAEGECFLCNILNISLDGIEIETVARLAIGETLKIGMFTGVVIRQTTGGYTIRTRSVSDRKTA